MTGWAVIASGQSVTQADAERVRHLSCVAVSDGFKLAPWARALIACDGTWWRETKGAKDFAGEKWCANGAFGIPRYHSPNPHISTSTNSGLLGLDYAVQHGATRVLLLGIDMQGTHFFGPHDEKRMRNTSPERFKFFLTQFANYAAWMGNGVEVINCSPVSALELWPKRSLDAALGTIAEDALAC